jgi:phage terminase large subunit-like protein
VAHTGLIRRTAEADGRDVEILLEEEPGSAGKSVTSYLIRALAGFNVQAERPTGAKLVRAALRTKAVSGVCRGGLSSRGGRSGYDILC